MDDKKVIKDILVFGHNLVDLLIKPRRNSDRFIWHKLGNKGKVNKDKNNKIGD